MNNIVFESDYQGIGELMRSDDMGNCMFEIAQTISGGLGEGYESIPMTGKTRRTASVSTTTADKYWKNVRWEHELLNAVSAGGIGL